MEVGTSPVKGTGRRNDGGLPDEAGVGSQTVRELRGGDTSEGRT